MTIANLFHLRCDHLDCRSLRYSTNEQPLSEFIERALAQDWTRLITSDGKVTYYCPAHRDNHPPEPL